jgi:hypothetical protein
MTALTDHARYNLTAARELLRHADPVFAEAVLEGTEHPKARQILALIRGGAKAAALREIDDALANAD